MFNIGDIFVSDHLTDLNGNSFIGELNMIKCIKFALPLGLLMFLLLATFQPKASTYYVDNSNSNANDNNPGTESAPWKTIQKGVDAAFAGDTVIVKYSIYNESILLKKSGNSTSGYIVFIGAGNQKPVIDGTGKSDKLINWNGIPDGGEQKNYIIVDGFEIKNAAKWAFWIQGDNNIVKNCKIHETGHTAIQLITGSNNTIRNNEIFNTGWNGISWEANNGNSGIRTDHNIIEYNYIHDINNHVGINGFPHEGSGNWSEFGGVGNIVRFNKVIDCLEGFYFRYEKEMEIYGNILVNVFGYQGIHFHYTSGDNSSTYNSNSRIYNNVIANCHQNGILNSNAKNLDIRNNIFYMNSVENSFYDIEFKSQTNSPDNLLDHNLYFGNSLSQKQINLYGTAYTVSGIQSIGQELNGLYSNPLFIDANGGNYMPENNSPSIDAGFNLGSPYNLDIIGITRPQGSSFDIGAYEIISGPDIYPPEITGAFLTDSITLNITFSENLEPASAQNTLNYTINGNISVQSAVLSGSVVTLVTSQHSPGNYTVSVSNITDLAGNLISSSANSAQYEFIPDPPSGLIQFEIIDVTASVTPEPEHSAEKCIDGIGYTGGDPDSRWAGDTMPEWLMFDLGVVKNLSLVKLSFYNWNNGRIYNYSISVSNNMNQWTEIISNTTSSLAEWTVNEFQAVEARYVKIVFLGSNQNGWAGLWEGELWGNNPTSVDEKIITPEGFNLEQNYPNPFNPSTTINYTLATSQKVILSIYNTLGQLVDEIVNGFQSAGEHEIVYYADGLASGVYLYQLQTESSSGFRKMILQK
jgi:hypothetical protein